MSERAEWQLVAGRRSVAAGRALVRSALLTWGVYELADDATLLVSEVLTNAVVHVGGPARLRLRLDDQTLTAEVGDGGAPLLPAPRVPDLLAIGGRGLVMVGLLASAWGVRQEPVGKTVWFSLRRDHAVGAA